MDETKPDIAVSNPYLPAWNVNDSYKTHLECLAEYFNILSTLAISSQSVLPLQRSRAPGHQACLPARWTLNLEWWGNSEAFIQQLNRYF